MGLQGSTGRPPGGRQQGNTPKHSYPLGQQPADSCSSILYHSKPSAGAAMLSSTPGKASSVRIVLCLFLHLLALSKSQASRAPAESGPLEGHFPLTKSGKASDSTS